jgi:nucleoside-diphosphate-sugar epimerase
VRGRNSDNTRLNKVLGWEPSIKLQEGLKITYEWIANELGVSRKPVSVAAD